MLKSIKRYLNQKYHSGSSPVVLAFDLLGYGGHWARRVMNAEIDTFIHNLPMPELSVAEISGRHFAARSWGSYISLQYPDFDLCSSCIKDTESYDLIFCEQVLEHVVSPQKALSNLWLMLKPNGVLVVSTPFLIKIHKCPTDFWRFTPDGLKLLLLEAGFDAEAIHTWGNRACVKANLRKGDWPRYRPFRNLRNEEDVPVVVWAYAKKRPR